jgi:uncharacterized membrane protein YqjE
MAHTASAHDLLPSLRRLLATLVDIGQVRLELLGAELELEKRRLFDALVWAALALVLLTLGLVALCGWAILLLWDGYRISAVAVMTLLLLGLGAALLASARRLLRNSLGLFALSVAELQRDQDGLRGGHPDA